MALEVSKVQQATLTPTADKKPVKVPGNCPNSIDGVEIEFAPTADKSAMSEASIEILKNILLACCIKKAIITSTMRDSYNQARVMYDNLVGKGPKQGAQYQLHLYGHEPGGKVVRLGISLIAQGKSRKEAIADMKKMIDEIGAPHVSRHCGDHTILNVFDVAPSSIPHSKKKDFEKKSSNTKEVSRFITPMQGDPGYHFEIPQHRSKSTSTSDPTDKDTAIAVLVWMET